MRFAGCTDQHMPQNQGAIGGQGTEDLDGFLIVEPVKAAAQGFAIDRDARQFCARSVQHRRMVTKGPFHIGRIQALHGVADRRVGGCPLPVQPAEGVQLWQPGLDEPLDLAIGLGVRQDGQNAEQQQGSQGIQPALGTTVIRNGGEKCRQQHRLNLLFKNNRMP